MWQVKNNHLLNITPLFMFCVVCRYCKKCGKKVSCGVQNNFVGRSGTPGNSGISLPLMSETAPFNFLFLVCVAAPHNTAPLHFFSFFDTFQTNCLHSYQRLHFDRMRHKVTLKRCSITPLEKQIRSIFSVTT